MGESENRQLNRQVFNKRAYIIVVAITIVTLALVLRLVWLQVWSHDRFVTVSEKNRIQLIPVAPRRGLVRDRNGLILAQNKPRMKLELIPEETLDVDQLLDSIGVRISLSTNDRERVKTSLQLRRRPRTPIPIKDDLDQKDLARLAVDSFLFPELRVNATMERVYPFGKFTGHLVGYLGGINEKELSKLDKIRYSATNVIGKRGIEKGYESLLHGYAGMDKVETNARGQIMRVIDPGNPSGGNDLKLHVDLGLQIKIHEILGNRRGSIVALDSKTGGILAMVSIPSFDPNLFGGGISSINYKKLISDPDLPLFNRALVGRYPPGSTIKPMMALVGLNENAIDWNWYINDPGFFKLPNFSRKFRDWKRGGHGRVDLNTAIIQSCDTFFYHLAVRLGIERISEGMAAFGFGKSVGLDVREQVEGVLPSIAWKKNEYNEPWYPGETVISGIGQGYWLTTPLQLAAATNTLANRGAWIEPRFSFDLRNKFLSKKIDLASEEDWELVVQAMQGVFHNTKGTAHAAARGIKYFAAGKTGTAQVASLDQISQYSEQEVPERLRDHALFVGFAPTDDPVITLAVVIENGGSGGATAAPVARKIFDYWILERQSGTSRPQIAYSMPNIPNEP